MARNIQFHIIAPHPDKRHKDLLLIACRSANEAQLRIEQLGDNVDLACVHVIEGTILPLMKQTRVLVGPPPKRRGRPPGSKNKPKPEVVAEAAAPKKRGRRKSTRKAKLKTVGALVKNGASKKRGLKKVLSEVVAEARNGKRTKDTQAERNARVETGT